MRPPKLDEWMYDAVAIMARQGCSLQDAANQLDIAVGLDEIKLINKRPAFTQILWEARHRYFNSLATDPNFKKDTAVGKLLSLAQKLEEEGQYDKASEVYFKIGKMQGWVGPESTVSVFGELSQKDLDGLRATLTKESKQRVQ